MIDLYLRANTEAEMTAALLAAGVINDDGLPVDGVSIDHIGSFSRFERPTWADEPIEEHYPGWHTNLRLMVDIDTSALFGYIIDTPATPYRVWA
jgi:hypothetical protein